MIILPWLQNDIVQYSREYAKALQSFGVEPPFAVGVSLTNVKGCNFLQEYMEGAFLEHIPAAIIDRDELHFVEGVFENVPLNDQDCATQLRATLDHMANAAGLPASQYLV